MSRRKYRTRRRLEYNRYLRSYKVIQQKLQNKGSDMYSEKYSFKEYFANKKRAIEDFREEHGLSSKDKVAIPNYLRDLVYSQAYYRDYEEVRISKRRIRENIKQMKQEILLGEEEITVKGKTKTVTLTEKDIAEREENIKWLEQANKYTIAEIRSGKEAFLDLLKEVNDKLRDDRKITNSYDRRAWIRKEFFGYAS